MRRLFEKLWNSGDRTRVVLALLWVVAGFGPVVRAETGSYLTPEPAYMTWKGPDSFDGVDVSASWQTACSAIGRRLTAGKGPLGVGAFSVVSCVKPSEDMPAKAIWMIQVRYGEDALSLTVRRALKPSGDGAEKSATSKFLEVARLDLPPSTKSLSALIAPGVPEMVAMRLLDAMPVAWWIRPGQVQADGKSIKGGAETASVHADQAPYEISLYRMRFEERQRIWIPEWIGRGQLLSSSGAPVWSVSTEVAAEIRETGIWAQGWKGRETRSLEWELGIRRTYEPAANIGSTPTENFLQDMLVKSDRVNRVGVRYGVEALPGTALMRKQRLMSAFCDLQHGPGAGWRLFADHTSKVTNVEDGQTESIGSDRYLVGFSLSIVPSSFVRRIDVTPRIGLWSMSADLPYGIDSFTGKPSVRNFAISRAGSGGVEMGVELGDGQRTMRLWYSMDYGVALLSRNGSSARANRVGLDGFIPFGKGLIVGDVTNVNFVAQLFAFYESINLGVSKTDAKTSTSGKGPDGITFADAFVGAGLGVMW